jgi:acetate kinase
MKVMVINSGSSSVKYEVFEASDFSVVSSGLLDRIGEEESRHVHRVYEPSGKVQETVRRKQVANHQEGFRFILSLPPEAAVIKGPSDLLGIGHRVVHGGEAFREPVLIDEKVVETIRELIPLAPLHNPANLLGIEAARQVFPGVPQVAVFDTAFHQTMPPHAYMYPLPYSFYALHKVRRYGFHGTSHLCVAKKAAAHLGKPVSVLQLITLHLGNGASAAAIRQGRSIDTSMGMTPLEGLVMGTRCGDLDPAIPFYLRRATQMSEKDLEELLNKGSGLKGICGVNDMREILQMAERGEAQAQLALDLYCYRVKKYLGAYFAVLGWVDAVVFTGGIGENAAPIRKRCCQGLEGLGIMVDDRKNEKTLSEVMEIQRDGAPVKVLAVRTQEEREIAEQTVAALQQSRKNEGKAYANRAAQTLQHRPFGR